MGMHYMLGWNCWKISSNLNSAPSLFFLSPCPLHFYQPVWLAGWLGRCWLEDKMTYKQDLCWNMKYGSHRAPLWLVSSFQYTCHIFCCPSKIKLFHLAIILSFQKKYIDVLVILPFIGGNFEKIVRLPLGQPKIMLRFDCSVSQGWMMWGM